MSESNIYSRDQKCCVLLENMTCLDVWHWNEHHCRFDGALLGTVKTRQWQAREQSDVILQSRWEHRQPADYWQLYKLYVILAQHLLALIQEVPLQTESGCRAGTKVCQLCSLASITPQFIITVRDSKRRTGRSSLCASVRKQMDWAYWAALCFLSCPSFITVK